MKAKKTIIGILVSFSIIIAVLAVFKIPKGSPTRQTDDKNIENEIIIPGKFHNKLDKKMDCAVDNVDLFEITNRAHDISNELAMGVEVNFSFKESRNGKSRRFSVQVSSMSKRKILDEIIRNNPGYHWEEKDGVVNILPEQPNKDFEAISPLDMTIPRFEVHQITPYFALEYLRRFANENNIPITTGLYEIAVKRGIKLSDSGKPEPPEDYNPEQLINVVIPHEVSIRDCLNAIVLANPPANWKAIKWKNGKTALFISSSQQGYSRKKRHPTHIKSPLIETTPPVVDSDSSPFRAFNFNP